MSAHPPGPGPASGDEDAVAPARSLADPVKLAPVHAFLEPWRWFFQPVFHGLDRIPDERPLLFVGNHTLYGLVDIPLLFDELWQRRRILLRGLADRGHYMVPLWRDLLTSVGAVLGTRENCSRLMRGGEAIVVFPGGSREVFKRRSEKYKLLWKERDGFARLAVEHGCTVVPFASVGVEDAWDIVADRDDYLATPLGRLARWLGVREDAMAPIATGIGPTPLPRPARIYFRVLDPIRPPAGVRGAAAVAELRDSTHDAIEAGIAALLDEQGRDPDSMRFSTIFGAVSRD